MDPPCSCYQTSTYDTRRGYYIYNVLESLLTCWPLLYGSILMSCLIPNQTALTIPRKYFQCLELCAFGSTSLQRNSDFYGTRSGSAVVCYPIYVHQSYFIFYTTHDDSRGYSMTVYPESVKVVTFQMVPFLPTSYQSALR